MSSRDFWVLAFLLVCLAALCAGCGGRVDLRPGRDAYYQVTNQVVPAQASGSHSQSATMVTSAGVGNTSSIPLDRSTTGPVWAN